MDAPQDTGNDLPLDLILYNGSREIGSESLVVVVALERNLYQNKKKNWSLELETFETNIHCCESYCVTKIHQQNLYRLVLPICP